jgi:CBS domain-containing protein
MTTAGEFCNRTVVIARRAEPLLDALARMRDHQVGCVVVVEDDEVGVKPVGLLTDRDVVLRLVDAPELELQRLRVDDVVAGELVQAWESDDLIDAIKRMRAYGVRRLPVIDEGGRLAGIITFDDLVEFFSEQLLDLATLLGRERRHEAMAHAH